jgi:O-antigen/teichoic acid export membrane protein
VLRQTSARMPPRSLPPPDARRVLLVVSLTSAVLGGLLAWAGVWFGGLGVAALGIGAAATLIAISDFARRDPARRPLAFMLGFAFAFAVLTWPILWLVVGYLRYLLTGESLGD